MLGNATITAFVATANPTRSKSFYRDTLGLHLVSGVQLRIQKVENLQPHPFTALGWHVPNIRTAILGLSKVGVAFERYSFLQQDDLGVWQAPSAAKVAWFKDPDGNLLSLTEEGAA